MKLCVFQGTFNPIHNAHIQAAKYALRTKGFEKILFIPAARPPHKEVNPAMSAHRLNMVKAAVKNYPEFEVSDIEYRLEGKSYTYNTIKKLYEIYPIDGKINFLIGTDAFRKIEGWYKADELKKLVDFVVFIRENNFDAKYFEYLKEKGYEFEFMPLEFLDISSTDIKKRIRENLSIQGLVPEEIEEYIKKYDLYKN